MPLRSDPCLPQAGIALMPERTRKGRRLMPATQERVQQPRLACSMGRKQAGSMQRGEPRTRALCPGGVSPAEGRAPTLSMQDPVPEPASTTFALLSTAQSWNEQPNAACHPLVLVTGTPWVGDTAPLAQLMPRAPWRGSDWQSSRWEPMTSTGRLQGPSKAELP